MGPTFEIEGAGMGELRAAFNACPQSQEVPNDVGYLAQALSNATRVVLGLDSPNLIEGPGIPELRLVIAMMTPNDATKLPVSLQRLLRAAQAVIEMPRQWSCGDPVRLRAALKEALDGWEDCEHTTDRDPFDEHSRKLDRIAELRKEFGV